jgi:hypothetical protein
LNSVVEPARVLTQEDMIIFLGAPYLLFNIWAEPANGAQGRFLYRWSPRCQMKWSTSAGIRDFEETLSLPPLVWAGSPNFQFVMKLCPFLPLGWLGAPQISTLRKKNYQISLWWGPYVVGAPVHWHMVTMSTSRPMGRRIFWRWRKGGRRALPGSATAWSSRSCFHPCIIIMYSL